jgi:ribonuclease D
LSSVLFIADQPKLDGFCAALEDADTLAVDTEFVRERTYFARLCVIQIAASHGAACIDCLADLDFSPLYAVLVRENSAWIAHSARQDLEIFSQAAHALPVRLIDTQIAAALLGFAPQIGLQDLLKETLAISLDKAHTRTDWSRRPLSDDALRYAIDDVAHLPALWNHLAVELERRGRKAWFEEDCERALHVSLIPDDLTLLERVKGSKTLRGPELTTALALVRWREQRARHSNRPRRWILSDDVLVKIARARPSRQDELERIAELPSRLAARAGPAILAAVADASNGQTQALAAKLDAARRPEPSELKALQQHVHATAKRLGLHPEVIAAKRDLVATALRNPPPQLKHGWRARALGLGEA